MQNLQNEFGCFFHIESFCCFYAACIFVHTSDVYSIFKCSANWLPNRSQTLTVNAFSIVTKMKCMNDSNLDSIFFDNEELTIE